MCLVEKHLLSGRHWLLPTAASTVRRVQLSGRQQERSSNSTASVSFLIIQDDLLHPYISGNKARKLDAVLPELVRTGVTDVVTCGGLQSAHTAAVAAAAAEHGIRSHLLIRGERPAIPTGHHLLALMFGSRVIYKSRAEYADRQAMLNHYRDGVREEGTDAKVAIISEGASGEASALLGFIRQVHWLATHPDGLPHPRAQQHQLVVDCGTGTTAVGLALGIAQLGLPWSVMGVMLAGTLDYYRNQQQQMTLGLVDYCSKISPELKVPDWQSLPLTWQTRLQARKFGRVLPGDIHNCKLVAHRHGVLLDPIYSLAAWEVAAQLAETKHSSDSSRHAQPAGTLPHSADGSAFCASTLSGGCSRDMGDGRSESMGEVVMVHCGGSLGLDGLAQRFPDQF